MCCGDVWLGELYGLSVKVECAWLSYFTRIGVWHFWGNGVRIRIRIDMIWYDEDKKHACCFAHTHSSFTFLLE